MPKNRAATVDLNEQNFDARVSTGIVLIDWWAPWCGPCRGFAPIYEQAAARHHDVVFGKVNTEQSPRLAQEFSIQAIPTLMVFKDGILIFSQPGLVPGTALDELVAQARLLDMDRVRAEIAQADAR